ncbi:hypothetical protein RB195_015538 [Necator americanus]|uniref:Follistatin-like domain-containing protein n=1 Tax=Necator americanus TaxID=51031 RepID=A0ABR1E594_NECAM
MQEFSSHIFAECLLALFCLTCATAKSYGPCAAVRCGFNTRCIEFNGSAKCYDTTCPTGEVFSECSSYCEPTCIPSDIACIQVCGPPACQCQPSFLRDNGKCVDPKLCSNKKVTTQSYVDEPITPSTSSCSPPCKPGFHCDDKTCVADEMKIPRCAEVRVKCQAGHHCEDTPTGITCAPDPICPANEVFNICASDCEQTCVPMGRPCTLNCLPPKCQCKDGYVREGGRCIDPKKCPNRKQSTDRIHESVMQSYVDEPITPVPLNCQSATIQILCVEGFHCEIANGAPTCVPNRRVAPKRGSQPSVTCATTLMLCRDGTHCEDINGKPKCVKDRGVSTDMPCKNVVCPSGQHCEFYRGVAQCTKSPGPCAAAFCAGGECIEYDNTFGCFNTNKIIGSIAMTHGSPSLQGSQQDSRRLPKGKRTRMAICSYNARTLASEAAIEDLMMQGKKIKYDVNGLTKTRQRHPFNAVYETLEEQFLGTCDSRGVGGVSALVNTSMAENIDPFEQLTTRIGEEQFEALYMDPEKFYQEDYAFYKVIIGDFYAKLGTCDSRGVGGVSVLVNTSMAKNIDSFEQLTTRIGRLRMRRCGPTPALNIFVAYAPTSSDGEEQLEAFYMGPEKFYQEDYAFYKLIIGDFYAKVGPRKTPQDFHIGIHGLQWNEQEERLSEFIMTAKTIHVNSQFQKPSSLRWTWESSGGGYSNETDHIIVNKRERNPRTIINWDLFATLAGFWEDSAMDNIDEEYDRLVEHLHDCAKKAESFKTTKRRLSLETLELIRQRGAARATGNQDSQGFAERR